MAQEEQILNSSHSDGTGDGVLVALSTNRRSNVKQKKVPQRGLGVAQLEKIRLEEQRKREALQAANVLAHNAVSDAPSPNLGSNLSPNLSPSSTNFPSPNYLYRSAPSIPLQITNQERAMKSTTSGPVSSNWPRLWGGESNLEREKQRVDHVGYTFSSPVNFQYYTNAPALPFLDVPQRSFQVQRPPSSSVQLQVNSYPGISPLPVFSSQMEPPSNQILHSNNYTASWLEEEKIVGMKRPYSCVESPVASSFLSDFHPSHAACRSRSDELPSCSGRLQVQEPRMTYIRDFPSNSCALPEQNLIELIESDRRLNGDFLSLAPPAAGFPSSNTKQKNPLDYSINQGLELPDFNFLPKQEGLKSKRSYLEMNGSAEQPFSFFPVESKIDQSTSCISNGNREQSETMDLNLKL